MKTLLFVLFSISAWAGPGHDSKVTVPKDFEALKALKGTWEGKTTMHGKEETTTVSYEVTSGGTAMIETLGKGSEHEMISMYSARGKNIEMKHYCAIGNQPEMKLKKADGKTFAFEGTGKGIDNPKEMHMHSLTITMIDADHLKQEWQNYENGKKGQTAVFEFTRKK